MSFGDMDPVSGAGPNRGCAKTLNLGFLGIQDLDQFYKPNPYLRNVIFWLEGMLGYYQKIKLKS
jgi:hypothetical protein